MREFIYRQQMQAIEDEVLPFGFIEDGRALLEPIKTVDETGQQWMEFPPEMRLE